MQDHSKRNVVLLALCQALAMTGMNVLATTAALVGIAIAPDPAFATLPMAVQFAGAMTASIPASLVMARIGRRAGFTVGTLIGAAGAAVAMLGVFGSSFWVFCLGCFMIGLYQGHAIYYRFAAADTASPAFRPKAISLVMAGGVVAGLFGPEAAKWSRGLFEPVLFAGCYLVILGFCLATAVILQFIRIPRPAPFSFQAGRPLGEIARQPLFLTALAGGVLAYAAMSSIMVASPLAVVGCGFAFEDAAFVIQWHVLGMYAPSFFTGHLIARFGHRRIMAVGALLTAAAVTVDVAGLSLVHFWLGLLLLGVGWNFLYVGGSALLTTTHRAEERGKVQATNDFCVFSMVTLATFSSGALYAQLGWTWVNLAVVPFVAAALAVLALSHRAARSAPAPAPGR